MPGTGKTLNLGDVYVAICLLSAITGGFIGQRKAWKKAYVRLAPDHKIEFFEGV